VAGQQVERAASKAPHGSPWQAFDQRPLLARSGSCSAAWPASASDPGCVKTSGAVFPAQQLLSESLMRRTGTSRINLASERAPRKFSHGQDPTRTSRRHARMAGSSPNSPVLRRYRAKRHKRMLRI
jgi:hypothetical protein